MLYAESFPHSAKLVSFSGDYFLLMFYCLPRSRSVMSQHIVQILAFFILVPFANTSGMNGNIIEVCKNGQYGSPAQSCMQYWRVSWAMTN